MKAARGHGPAARLSVRHHRFMRNAAKPKRKNHQRSSANMRIANALRQSAGISRSAKRNHGRNNNNNSEADDNPLTQSASSPPVRRCAAVWILCILILEFGFSMFFAVFCGGGPWPCLECAFLEFVATLGECDFFLRGRAGSIR